MGGHERGEVASQTVAKAMGRVLSATASAGKNISRATFEKALASAYDALENIDGAESDRKPGTTLTCLCINPGSVLAAHIGDSRIYQIRPSMVDSDNPESGIIYRSEDHSLVNDLVRAGQITPQQARTHPRRNVITRAMQPKLEHRFAATIHQTSDVKSGDYFFLCSDGVLEQLTDATLCRILATPSLSDTEKSDAIKAECNRGTRDNFTACLIPVNEADIVAPGKSANPYRWPLYILLMLCIIAAFGIISFYAGWFRGKAVTPDTIIDSSTAIAPPPPAVIDTIVMQTPADSLKAAPADVTVTGMTDPTRDSVTTKPKKADTTHNKNAQPVAQPAPMKNRADSQPKAVTKSPDSTRPAATDAVPQDKKSTGTEPVPERKKQKSEPKPLA